MAAHQVMAINRGESQKVLTTKLLVPDHLQNEIIKKCWTQFVGNKPVDQETSSFLDVCIKDAYDRLLEPHIVRQIRSQLTKKATTESVSVFCSNLKKLLLTPPFRGKTVIGVDPGFKHGCKLAVVSHTGEVLATDVIYPHQSSIENEKKLAKLVFIHNATVIALGNGTACRETEMWLSNMISNKGFHPHDVKYCIIDESGASVYSVTKEAEIEFPNMDPNLRSAVTIAKRLQDPLLEYVKVEAKHLGVGMYQHDIPDNLLKSALDGVVEECVSFVGVDLNVCPEVLLRKISGLSNSRVKNIIEWREKNGGFTNIQQLLEVKGLGPKSFEQCAGFVKIFPQTSPKDTTSVQKDTKKKKKSKESDFKPDLLDTTIIHPESYDVAKKFLVEVGCDLKEIGQQPQIDKIKNYVKSKSSVQNIAQKFGVAVEQTQLIVDALQQPMNSDIRDEFDVPLFKTGVKAMSDLKTNETLTGRVTNVTNFGAFVDIGVGQNGLIHNSQMKSRKVQLGDKVTVKVLSLDISKKRIGLKLIS